MELIKTIFIFLIMLVLFQYFGRYIWRYSVQKTRIQIYLFYFIPFYHISLNKITDITKISTKEMLSRIFTLHWINKLYSKEFIMLTRKAFIFTRLIISPEDPDTFISQIRKNQEIK